MLPLVARQPSCTVCGCERHILPCDWCLCPTSPEVGVYLTPWPVLDDPEPID